jgi:hypothetical protein
LCGLSSEATGLLQPTRIGQVAFCFNKEYIIKVHHRDRYPDKWAIRFQEEAGVRNFVISAGVLVSKPHNTQLLWEQGILLASYTRQKTAK